MGFYRTETRLSTNMDLDMICNLTLESLWINMKTMKRNKHLFDFSCKVFYETVMYSTYGKLKYCLVSSLLGRPGTEFWFQSLTEFSFK